MTSGPANGNGNPNNANPDRGWFCPSCGGANITASTLTGGAAKCNICTWTGKVEELPTFLFTHDMGSPEEVHRAFFLDVRKLLSSTFAASFGQLLIKWGFLDQPDTKNKEVVVRTMSRYLGVCCSAIAKAIVTERALIEKEKHERQPSA